MGRMFLIVVDAHSKWLEVYPTSSATSSTTIEMLRTMLATHSLPETVVTDNGSVFTSEEFGQFMQLNGVKHIKSAPYHPASNGLAERAVETFKEGLKKQSAGSIQARVSWFLFAYHITPHSSTGQSPAKLLLGHRPRSHLDVMHPQVDKRVHESQERQKANHDWCAKARTFYSRRHGVRPQFGKWFSLARGHRRFLPWSTLVLGGLERWSNDPPPH